MDGHESVWKDWTNPLWACSEPVANISCLPSCFLGGFVFWGWTMLRCKSHRSRRDPSSLPRAGPAQHHYTGFQQQVSLYWWFCKRCLAAPKICLSNSQRSVGEGKAVLSSLEEETLLQGIASQFLISHGAMGTFLSVSWLWCIFKVMGKRHGSDLFFPAFTTWIVTI